MHCSSASIIHHPTLDTKKGKIKPKDIDPFYEDQKEQNLTSQEQLNFMTLHISLEKKTSTFSSKCYSQFRVKL